MAKITYNNGYYEGDVNRSGEEHGHGTFVWDNGDKYVGQFQYRKFSGQGTYYYANGAKYVGQWANDLKHGKGTMYFANGNVYEGNWVNDKENGFGKETYKWGYYEGQWKDGDWYGKGKEVHYNGITFEGDFRGFETAYNVTRTENGVKTHGKIEDKKFIADALNGYATMDYDNGSYTGMFKDGLRHGQGVYNWTNGGSYNGGWENDKKSGYAVYTASWGRYEGYYKNDERYGNGKEILKNGEVYEGFWLDMNTSNDMTRTVNGVSTKGKMINGKFVANEPSLTQPVNKANFKKETYNNGYYEGEIVNGKRNGFGTYYWNSGSRYEGNWVNDVRTGFGKFFWTDGGRYEGNWANDKMNGQGTFYSANGSTFVGQWKDDNKYYGKQTYSWGSYEGYWDNKTWCGQGTEIVNGGSTFEALWQDAKNATSVVKTSPNGQKAYGKIVDGTFFEE